MALDQAILSEAYGDNPALLRRVYEAIAAAPQSLRLYEDMAKHTCAVRSANANVHRNLTLNSSNSPTGTDADDTSNGNGRSGATTPGEAPAKKRKLSTPSSKSSENAGLNATDAELCFHICDVSFSVPQRKKLRLELTKPVETGTSVKQYLRARNQQTSEVEFGVPVDEIEHIFCLPVPEKAQRQYNFCIIPIGGNGLVTTMPPRDREARTQQAAAVAAGQARPGSTALKSGSSKTYEPFVFNVPDGPPRSAYLGSSSTAVTEAAGLGETYVTYLTKELNRILSKGRAVVGQNEKELAGAVSEPNRKRGEPYYVRAFRGSKEGYLYFLSSGIIFGFRKPLLVFSFSDIESISYTSVLQRTFNLNIAIRIADHAKIEEVEFGMIDQAHHAGVDDYVSQHGLQDSSLAESRRAKLQLQENGSDEADNKEQPAPGPEQAGQDDYDEEDEAEEDYVPPSDDDGDGGSNSGMSSSSSSASFSSSSEDSAGRDLVREELGSEAEEPH